MDEVRSTRLRGAGLLLSIFLMGMIAGASIFYVGQRSVGDRAGRPGQRGSDPKPLHPLDRMARELNLSTEQHEKLRALLDGHKEQLETLLEDSRVAIREILTKEQREQFDQMRPPGPRHGRRPPPGHHPPPPGH